MISVKSIIKQSLPSLVLVAALGMVSGILLDTNKDSIMALPGILLAIPSFINIGGVILSVLVSRLSSALHMGLIGYKNIRRTKTLENNIKATYFNTFVSYLFIGVVVGGFNSLLGFHALGLFVFPIITLIAGLLTVSVLSVMGILFTYVSFRKGIDPENWVIAIMTTLGDMTGIFFLFTVVMMFI